MAQINLKNALIMHIGEGWPHAQGAEGLSWVIYDGHGELTASGGGAPPASTALSAKRRIAIALSAVTLLMEVDAPAKNRARFLLALPNAAEGSLSCPAENIHTSAGPWSDDGKLPVAVVSAEWMKKCVDKLEAMGLAPDSMIPEILLAPIKPDAWSVVIDGERHFIRTGPYAGMEMDAPANGKPPTALAILLEEARRKNAAPDIINIYTTKTSAGYDAADWIEPLGVQVVKAGSWSWFHAIKDNGAGSIELLQGPFEKATPIVSAPWIAAIALILALTGLAHLGALAMDLRALRHDKIMLSTQLEKSFRLVFGAATMVDPVPALEKRLDELRWRAGLTGPHGPDGLLAMAATAIAANARLKALDYSAGQLRLTLVMNSGKTVGDLAGQISTAGLDCKVLKSELRDGGLSAELLITEEAHASEGKE